MNILHTFRYTFGRVAIDWGDFVRHFDMNGRNTTFVGADTCDTCVVDFVGSFANVSVRRRRTSTRTLGLIDPKTLVLVHRVIRIRK
jgi:hypothetical protein